MSSTPKLWFNTYYGRFQSSDPVFYPTEQIGVADYLKKKYPLIREELSVLWEDRETDLLEQLGDFSAYDDKQFPPNSWKKIVFKVWGLINPHVCERFPETASLLDKFPEITSCFVTRLDAKSIIKLHGGETNAHYRTHLGLKVEESDVSRCGIEINGKQMNWENGKVFTFLDAHQHHVWNHSDHDRYVLIIDTIRPSFKPYRSFIYARVIFSQLFIMFAIRTRMKFLYRTPGFILNILAALLYLPIMFGIFLQNKFGLKKF